MPEKSPEESPPISFEVASGGIAVVRLNFKRLRDPADANVIAQELSAIADRDDVRAVLINLAVIEHFSSSFIGVLASLRKRLSEGGRKLAVCRLRPEPLRVFRICRMDAIIPVYDSEEEAHIFLRRASAGASDG